jgi:hypothetical protein
MPIPARELFAATLRILASGESIRSIHFQFRIGEKTLQRHFRRVCKAIYKVLKDRYMKVNTVSLRTLLSMQCYFNNVR